MPDGFVSIVSAVMQRPISLEQADFHGMTLYCCLPCCSPDTCDCSHYLAVLGVPGYVRSDEVFTRLALFGCYSFQWLTYYMEV